MFSAALYAHVRTSTTIAHETAGAARIRHSLRPLTIEGEEFPANLGRNASRDRETAPAAIASHRARIRATRWLAMTIPNQLNRFTRIRHRGRKTAVDRDRLAVDIGSVVAGEEQSHRGEFVRLPG